jgi:hypothetical protein
MEGERQREGDQRLFKSSHGRWRRPTWPTERGVRGDTQLRPGQDAPAREREKKQSHGPGRKRVLSRETARVGI